jgi:hypothetical protein
MEFIKKDTLACHGSIDQFDLIQVDSFLVSNKKIIRYIEEENRYGESICELFPVKSRDGLMFLKQVSWNPALGYSCYTIDESLIPFSEGVKIIREERRKKIVKKVKKIANNWLYWNPYLSILYKTDTLIFKEGSIWYNYKSKEFKYSGSSYFMEKCEEYFA